MARPKGQPKLGGRKKGTPNKLGKDVRELAREYTEEAIAKLASVMMTSKSHQAAVMAADKLLDRGWGKAAQVINGNVRSIREIRVMIVDHGGNPGVESSEGLPTLMLPSTL